MAADYHGNWAPQWVDPEDISARSVPTVLTATQVEQWRTLGYCVVTGLWPPELIAKAKLQVETAWPDGKNGAVGWGPTVGRFPYPAELHALNEVTMCPRYHAAARQLLYGGADEDPALLLTWSHSLAKFGSTEIGGGGTGVLGHESFASGAQPFHQVRTRPADRATRATLSPTL